MRTPYTAVLQLAEALTPMHRDDIRTALRVVTGVSGIEFEATDPVVTVDFDGARTGLAEIVRVVEDLGLIVRSVAQRVAWPASAFDEDLAESGAESVPEISIVDAMDGATERAAGD